MASVSGATETAGASGTSYTVTIPSASAGDEISVFVGINNNGSATAVLSTAASGWTKRGESNNGDFGKTYALFTKTAGSSEPTTVQIDNDTAFSEAWIGCAVVVTDTGGLDVAGSVSAVQTSGTTVDAPGVNVSADGSLLITHAAIIGFDAGGLAWTAPATTTDLNNGTTGSSTVETESASLAVDAGAQSALTWTNASSGNQMAAVMLVYSPATPTVTHYYGIYTSGNGPSASIANIKAGAGTGFVAGGNTTVDTGLQATFNPTGLTPNTAYDMEYVMTSGTDTRAASTAFRTGAFEDVVEANLTANSQAIYVDKDFLVAQANLTVNSQDITYTSGAVATKLSFTLYDRANGSALTSVTGIEYAVFLDSQLGTLGAPIFQGNTEVTDGSGVIEITTTNIGVTVGQDLIVMLRKAQGAAGGSDDDWGVGVETTVAGP